MQNQASTNPANIEYMSASRLTLRQEIDHLTADSKRVRSSPLGRLKYYWDGNPKMRIAIGIGLLASGGVATATGAFAAAGVLLAARAGLGAIGAYTTAGGLYDMLATKNTSDIAGLLRKAERGENIGNIDQIIERIEQNHTGVTLTQEIAESRKLLEREKKVRAIVCTTAGAVSGILGLTGIPGVSGVSGVAHAMPDTTLGRVGALDTIGKSQSLGSISDLKLANINEIFSDIRADHPTQGYLTLEQSIRRIEGLRMGIPLSESGNLSPLNISINNFVHDPNGPIAKILLERGLITDGQSIDAACRKLSVGSLQEICEKYIQVTTPETSGNAGFGGILTQADEVPIGVPSSAQIVQQGSNITQAVGMSATQLATAGVAALVGRGIAGSASTRGAGAQMKDFKHVPTHSPQANQVLSTPPAQTERRGLDLESNMMKIQQTPIPQPIQTPQRVRTAVRRNTGPVTVSSDGAVGKRTAVRQSNATIQHPTPPQSTPSSSQATNTGTVFQLPESAERVKNLLTPILGNEYNWEHNPERTQITADSLIQVYEGATVGGSYDIYIKYTSAGVQMSILWYDGDAKRQYSQTDVLSYGSIIHSSNPEEFLKEKIDAAYLDLLEKREVIKQKDLEGLHTVVIPRLHRKVMYEHLEQPAVKNYNNEVLGYWIASAYLNHNGRMKFIDMQNPRLDEQVINPISCRPKDLQINAIYNFVNPNTVIYNVYPPAEAQQIVKSRVENARAKGAIVLSGAAAAWNWHKHPDGYLQPSGGDISEAAHDLKVQFPGRNCHFWGIAVRISKREADTLMGQPDVLVLHQDEFGGEYSYAVRTYNCTYRENYTKHTMKQLSIELAD